MRRECSSRAAFVYHPTATEMKANNPKILIPIALAVVLVILLSSVFTGGKPYSTNLDDLRTQFNADKGKVRLLMLLSPT
jgi:hypothetical protein